MAAGVVRSRRRCHGGRWALRRSSAHAARCRDIFRSRGYLPVDYLRPLITGDPAIQSWYRYNILLYVEAGRLGLLPEALRAYVVRDGDALRDYRPLTCRLQQALVRRLPVSTV